jgi:hypothetical protein
LSRNSEIGCGPAAPDQRLGGGGQFARLLDGELKSLRHGQAIVMLRARIACVVEQSRRCRFEAIAIVVEGDFEPLPIGRCLFV